MIELFPTMQKNFRKPKTLYSLLNTLRIKDKLLWLYGTAFLVPSVIIFIILASWLYTTLKNWQLEQTKSSMMQTATVLRDELQNVENISNALYINRTLQNTLSRQYESSKEVYEQYLTTSFLDDFLQANGDISSIRFYTENPTILDNAYFLKAPKDVLKSDWYMHAKLLKGKSFWVMKKDTITKKQMLSLVRAVQDFNSQNFVGVLSISIEYEKINRYLKNAKNPSYISLNDTIDFSSTEIPENRQPDFLEDRYSPYTISEVKTEWENRSTLVLINQIYGSSSNSILLMEMIPRSQVFTKTAQGMYIYLVITIIGLTISLAFILIFSKYFNKRVNYINSEIQKVVKNNFEIGPHLEGTDELSEIYGALETMTDNTKQLIDEVYQHKIEQAQLLSRQNDIRFKMLSSQINPHFLFNTLETIRMQALSDGNRDVANTIKLLSKILRHNLTVSDRPVPVMEEIDAISNYLDIQHLRFADRVSYDIIYMCDIRDYGILPLLIQPVVENSFIHGLESRSKGGFIYINIESDGTSNLYIKVRDNGCGMNTETLEALRQKLMTGTVEDFNSSIGMVNVNQRIKLYYGSQYGLNIESEENVGTTVTIHVPMVPLSIKGE